MIIVYGFTLILLSVLSWVLFEMFLRMKDDIFELQDKVVKLEEEFDKRCRELEIAIGTRM